MLDVEIKNLLHQPISINCKFFQHFYSIVLLAEYHLNNRCLLEADSNMLIGNKNCLVLSIKSQVHMITR